MYEGNNKYPGTACISTPSRPISVSIAQEVAKLAERLADRAETLAVQVSTRLEPVMTCAVPTGQGEVERPDKEYPPFFDGLRNKLQDIEKSLSGIEDAISRTAI